MAFVNLTPHSVQVYGEKQFQNLEQLNPTTWVADSVEGDPIVDLPSEGCLRIATDTQYVTTNNGVPIVETTYGNLVGMPDSSSQLDDDDYIVSLPAQSMIKQMPELPAGLIRRQFLAPYKVVRLRSNTSQILGCMGFTL